MPQCLAHRHDPAEQSGGCRLILTTGFGLGHPGGGVNAQESLAEQLGCPRTVSKVELEPPILCEEALDLGGLLRR